MTRLTRRDSLAFFTPFSKSPEEDGANQGQTRRWAKTPSREMIRQRYFPNLLLTTQENKKVYFYDDLIKGKVVLINFMFTSCDRICPKTTQNLGKVQHLLGKRVGREIFMYSFTLDPGHDTPEVLREYAKLHHVGAGWQFLTGSVGDMETLRRRLGFVDPDPALDKDKESHIGNVRYGNEPRQLWGACPGMSKPEFIVESLSWVEWRKGEKRG
ncbi:MAG TPA: SCO family protein [Terriglobales bacterium]|nr:SCO family protein [Terriglobales bacterium]